MKLTRLLTAVLITFSAPLTATPIFKLDPSSRVKFHVQATFENVTGTFHKLKLEKFEFNGRPESLKGRLAILIDSLETGKAKRDSHLKEDDFFDARKYPEAYVDVLEISQDDGDYYVRFILEIRGIRKEFTEPIQLKADMTGIQARGTFVVNRKDFGVNGNILTNTIISDEVTLEYNIVLVR
jgi:polyisoprenoid-binding protein YceI